MEVCSVLKRCFMIPNLTMPRALCTVIQILVQFLHRLHFASELALKTYRALCKVF